MISSIYHAAIYQPLYNGLVGLISILPWADVGIVVILFTIIIKLALFPLSKKSVATQIQMKKIEPDIAKLREEFKDNKQELALRTMQLYKEKGVRPFLSVLLVFIQLPIIFALYRVFWHSGLPVVNTELLYSFIHAPSADTINMNFLGLINVSSKSIVLAVLVGISTFFQTKIMAAKLTPAPASAQDTEADRFKKDLAKSMHLQMKYVLPLLTAFISYGISAAISLYWITSNIFTIGQEIVLKRKLDK